MFWVYFPLITYLVCTNHTYIYIVLFGVLWSDMVSITSTRYPLLCSYICRYYHHPDTINSSQQEQSLFSNRQKLTFWLNVLVYTFIYIPQLVGRKRTSDKRKEKKAQFALFTLHVLCLVCCVFFSHWRGSPNILQMGRNMKNIQPIFLVLNCRNNLNLLYFYEFPFWIFICFES